ncbi:MAG: DinB family protein, partial [Acidobacteria bacterium]|nr:DinB family protein [Acidobacteriota bacterium]
MSIAESMIQELVGESATTQKLLERIPDDRLTWQPHEKSMSMSRLATHVAEIPSWVPLIVGSNELDLAKREPRPRELGSRKEILDIFHAQV